MSVAQKHRPLPDAVRDHAETIFARIAARTIGTGGYQWTTVDQKDIAERCITAAVIFNVEWLERRQIHNDAMATEPSFVDVEREANNAL